MIYVIWKNIHPFKTKGILFSDWYNVKKKFFKCLIHIYFSPIYNFSYLLKSSKNIYHYDLFFVFHLLHIYFKSFAIYLSLSNTFICFKKAVKICIIVINFLFAWRFILQYFNKIILCNKIISGRLKLFKNFIF